MNVVIPLLPAERNLIEISTHFLLAIYERLKPVLSHLPIDSCSCQTFINMLHLPVTVALLASAASARYYYLHPQGQPQYCLAIDPCSGGDKREFSLVTDECDNSDNQKWGTRLIGDTETITWYPLSAADRCINGNSEQPPRSRDTSVDEANISHLGPAPAGPAGARRGLHARPVQQVAGLGARRQPADRGQSRRDS